MKKYDIYNSKGYSLEKKYSVNTHKLNMPVLPKHFHDYYEIEFVLEGNGINNVNGNNYPLCKNTIYLLSPTDCHEILSDSSLTLLNFAINISLINDKNLTILFQTGTPFHINLNEEQASFIKFMHNQLKNETNNSSNTSELFCNFAVNCVISFIINNSNQAQQNNNIIEPILKSIKYLYQNFQHNPTLKECAKLSGYQTNYFCKVFKSTTGYSFSKFLKKIKIIHAIKLLKTTDCQITEICIQSGYNSISQFNRDFKNITNKTPSDFKKTTNYFL